MIKLKKLCALNAVSGFESMSDKELFQIFKSYGFNPKADEFGNVYGEKTAKDSKFSLLIDAHRDEIGLIISEICENGFLKFSTVGGVDINNLYCTEVTVYGKEPVYGVIGALPPHLKSNDEEILYIDTGIKNIGNYVKIGDPVKFKTEFMNLKNNQLCSGALDDRAGLFCALEAAALIENINVTVLASAREETGTQGIEHFLNAHNFDLAINIDVTHGYFEGLPDYRAYPVGDGFTICYGGILDNRLTQKIENYLTKNKYDFNIEFEPSNPGTNSYNTVTHNILAIMLSVPLKYMHTTCEVLNTDDLKNLIKFISEYNWEDEYKC